MMFARNGFVVTGGLGNQLFIVAAANAFSTQTGRAHTLNLSQVDANVASHGNTLRDFLPSSSRTSAYLPSRNLRIARVIFEAALERLLPRSLKFESKPGHVGFNPALLEVSGNKCVIRGYFQSHYYLALGDGLVHDIFSKMQAQASWGRDVSSRFDEDETIGFHVRRGDYLTHGHSLGLLDYEKISEEVGVLRSGRPVAVFCEDLEYGREISHHIGPQAYAVQKPDSVADFEELVAMANCRTLVISNSSFSFWAGCLGVQKEVYYPTPWFRHIPSPSGLTPPHWHPYAAMWDE